MLDIFLLFQPNNTNHFILYHHQVDHVDKSGQSALVHAALRGHPEIIQYLLELEWSAEGQQQDCTLKNKALQQAFIAASSMGHTQVRLTRVFYLTHNQPSPVPLHKETIDHSGYDKGNSGEVFMSSL